MDAVYQHHHEDDASAQQKASAVRNLFRDHETELLQPFLDFLEDHPKVRLIGKSKAVERAPTVAFIVQGHRSTELATQLNAYKLGIGVGHFYAYRLVEALGIDTDEGVLRASFVHYTSPQEVTRLIEALDELM